MDYTQILKRKFPNTEWILDGDDYAGLTWLSDSSKPTKSQLDKLWDEVANEIELEKANRIASKKALLERLGITADEAKLLLS